MALLLDGKGAIVTGASRGSFLPMRIHFASELIEKH